MKDYYSLLNLSPNASGEQIDAAYRGLMQKYHPNARSSPQTLERLRELNEAWRVLSDPTQRAAYNRACAEGVSFQPQTAPVNARVVSQAPTPEFGARRSRSGSCLVRFAVAAVLIFALGILVWGLNQQVDFRAWWEQTQREVGPYLLPGSDKVARAVQAVTPTPDPRCRNGCETPPEGCVVKGDSEAGGARYFYLPNDAGYSSVRINVSAGDRWFCTAGDAQATGWTRKAPTETPTPPPPLESFITPVARRSYIVCNDQAALRQGPGDDFPITQSVASGARVAVSGMSGDWSVVNQENGIAYIQSVALCTPTRAAANVVATPDANAATPLPAQTMTSAANPANAFKYPAPRLVKPTHGERYWCKRELVFEWVLDAPALGADEFFLIESKPHEQGRWTALADWTRELRVILYPNRGGGSCETVWWTNTGAYEWRVSVVRGNKEMPQYLSPFSIVNDIIYAQ